MRGPDVSTSAKLASAISAQFTARARWSPLEVLFWLAALATIWLAPDHHLILTEIVIWALLALSLDLILGYAGIISLGHAAFFGIGAYTAGLLAKHALVSEPVLALLVSGAAGAAFGFLTSFLVLRGTDLTRLMVTLGVALLVREIANRAAWLTGGADGLQGIGMEPVLGLFRFDLYGHTAYAYSLVVLFVLFVIARRIVGSPFGLSLQAIKGNPLRASAVGIGQTWRLVGIYTLAAAYAGVAGGLLTQTTAFTSLESLSFDRSADALLVLIIGGTGHLYGGLIGAVVFRFAQDWISAATPQYWQFWIGLFLVLIVLVGRDRIGSWVAPVRRLADRVSDWRAWRRPPAVEPTAPGEGGRP
ncbi:MULTISPECIES: branched-chain amino acid ABC transporter permease [Rhodoplanes]|uniref:branched-chain amino acid ABC transporter permease n=1 Tax=Rhodoplanes TaxID=29407 RepID=UPI00254654AE|nr:branched-chain amino acid ABC transporter permease [Rhodoplanes tepidamans]